MRRLPLRSPPRVRGKVPVCCPEHRKVRITPAYAGKRDLVISGSGDIEDHPRVCGEKFTLSSSTAVSPGSPPRMRGKAPAQTLTGSASRITPACAGKRQRQSGHNEAYRDHPRVCGEKVGMGYRGKAPVGSPPRMRGKVYAHRSARVRCGITPAYAGKSSYTSDRAAVSRDHPRVCGEKYWRHSCPQMRSGSPPRMRGKVLA